MKSGVKLEMYKEVRKYLEMIKRKEGGKEREGLSKEPAELIVCQADDLAG